MDELLVYPKGNTNMSNVPANWTDDPTNKILKTLMVLLLRLGFETSFLTLKTIGTLTISLWNLSMHQIL